ncbi:MAG: hypothetical protein GQ569_14300 [Methylococcaceae bacterium]|nr:hypothetical protein [Methylococcaceae bacterium]
MNQFYSKDYIETAEGLRFAVLKNGDELGKILCFLRYACFNGEWRKVTTAVANALLKEHHPQYLHYSKQLDAHLHAVEVTAISQHYQARLRLQQLLKQRENDKPSADLITLCQLLAEKGLDFAKIGITGSLSVGMQKESSDIDLVFYDRDLFHHARKTIAWLIAEDKLQALGEQDWREAFERRGCDLSFEDYVWHELRKYNKALIHGRKFDISLCQQDLESDRHYYKRGKVTLKVKVTDDRYGFDYPAEFLIEHPEIRAIVCFTATYNGQAQAGEWVEVSGQLEISNENEQQIVVGSTREAEGEYIKVIDVHGN